MYIVRHPTFKGRHTPSNKSIQRHLLVLCMRVWMAEQLLKLTGRAKQAAALSKGFTAFQEISTPG